MFDHILLATDFSTHAETAKRIASALAKKGENAHLWVLTILEPLEEPVLTSEEPTAVPAEAWQEASRKEREELEARLRACLHQEVAALRDAAPAARVGTAYL